MTHPALFSGPEMDAEFETPEERTLRARARRLAAGSVAEQTPAQAGVEVLVCRLHDEWYALDLALLSAVHPARGVTPLPGTPAFIAGLLNVRGTIVTILDLARGLHLPAVPPTEDARILLTDCAGGGGQGPVGLLVQEVRGVRHLAVERLDRALSGDPAVRGIAEAGIVVLDLALLLADGRFEVTERW